MSDLRYKATAQQQNLSQAFLEESKNKVHLTDNWEAVVRYCEHGLVLTRKLYPNPHGPYARESATSDTVSNVSYDEIPLGQLPVVLRCQLWGKPFLNKDEHDHQGVTTTQGIKPDVICIAVESRQAEGRYFWLPLEYYDEARYRPAYPDNPNLPTQYAR